MSDYRTQAADVIEPHVTGRFKRRERAEGIATSLDDFGLLHATELPDQGNVDRAANHLACVMNWPTAQRCAEALYEAGLLTPAEVAS